MAQAILGSHEGLVLADHDMGDSVEEDGPGTHLTGRQGRVDGCLPVIRSRQPPRVLEGIHLAVEDRRCSLDAPVVAPTHNLITNQKGRAYGDAALLETQACFGNRDLEALEAHRPEATSLPYSGAVPRIAVAGPSSVVTDAAVAVGEEGGSVVDVAIVAALTAMCTEPGVCGPGGGGFLAIDLPDRDPVVIDGYMTYPGLGFVGEPVVREVSMSYGGGVTTLVDAGSIAVPGVFAGMDLASTMFGAAPWGLLMEAVAQAVEHGFPLSAPCYLYLNEGAAPIYLNDPVARDALFDGDHSHPQGTNIVFPGLANTLRHIGQEGAEVFYLGDLGQAIVEDLAGRGGKLTMADLKTYQAVARPPIMGRLGDWRLAHNPPPAVGGQTVDRTLELTVGSGAAARANALVQAFEERRTGAPRSASTISVAAADEDGGVVAGSFSAGYGSGLIPEGTGMLMNNALGELELVDGHGEPGERLPSNMAPTVARSNHQAVAVGSPGADRITTAVATTVLRLAEGDSLQQSIDYPRLHPEFGDFGVRLAVEPGQDLAGIEYEIREFDRAHMYFGGVNGAALLDGHLRAHADARRTGSVGFTA